ncbi:MAG: two-component system cell cycle response regulator [Methylophilaceae bacterium]|jgi:two-component system cell cycle response regulator
MLETEKRRKEPLSILLIDIDNFKKINDKMSPLEGDRVLKSIAHILQNSICK